MVVGVVVGRYVGLATAAYLLTGLLCLAGAGVAGRREHLHALSMTLLLVGVLGLSAAYARWQWQSVPADDVVNYTREAKTLVCLRGRIDTAPMIVRDGDGPPLPYKREDRTVFVLAASEILCPPSWQPASGLVKVRVDQPCQNLRAGQEVEMECWLGRFGPARNPGEADPRELARQGHTLTWASVAVADGVRVLGPPANWYERIYWNLRSAARQHLAATGEEESGELVTALLVGDRHPALQKLNESMKRSGVAHYLSISGSHLAIFLGFFYALCRVLMLRPKYAAMAALVVLAVYLMLTEASPPLLRSAIMAASLCLAVIFHRQHAALNAMAAAAIVLLLIDPMDLFSPGFQLSFGIVLGMLLLTEPIRQAIFGRWLRRRGLVVFRDEDRVRRWLSVKGADAAITAVSAALAAYLASAPLVAYHFGLVSPYAGVLSMVLVLPMTAVLVPGYISLALLSCQMPNLASVFDRAAGFFADVVVRAVGWMEYLPGLCVSVRPVGVACVVLAYVVLGLWLLRNRLPGRWAASAAALVLLAGLTVATQWPAQAPPGARLHVLAVGSGQCAVLHLPSGQTAIFDAGTLSGYDLYQQTLEPFIRTERLPWPSVVFVSHAHLDHCAALIGLLRDHPPAKIYLGPYFTEEYKMEAPAEQFLALARQKHIPIEYIHAGDVIALDERTKVRVFWPPSQPDNGLPVNDTSLMLKITCDGQSVMLPGDVEDKALATILAEHSEKPGPDAHATVDDPLHADVLLLPHHGGWSNHLPDLVARVRARFVLASRDRDSAVGSGDDGTKAKFYATLHQKPFFATWRNGCIHVTFGEGKVGVTSAR